jgi:ribulose-5-phosphate 4-epimerase/fuculose-1-phosphate aldolase
VDATAWAIHGQIHQRLPEVRVVLHLHPVYTTSVACLDAADPADRSEHGALF